MAPVATLADYYADPAVRARIREYCGGTSADRASAVFVAAMTGNERPFALWEYAPRYPLEALDRLLSAGADLARSIWDASSLLIHLDLDYLNIDVPGEAYHHPAEVFFKLEPVFLATIHVLRRFGVPLLCLTTGQGYHFTGRVPLDSDVTERLSSLAPDVPEWFRDVDRRRPPWLTAEITARHARAYTGGAMLTEFLAHAIVKRAARRSRVPLVLNGTIVGSGLVGRECISIDLSYAGDPMDVRHLRVGFGAYQKHRFRPDIVGNPGASAQPPLIAVPRGADSLRTVIARRRDFRHAAREARSQSTVLPIVTDGMRRVLSAYEASTLAIFHREFYATPRRSDRESAELFESLPLSTLPNCVVRPLRRPNDLLLQPAVVQHVTRALLSRGVSARDIAAIVRSRYLADFTWGPRWTMRNASTRAEFDVRVFAGLLATGVDRAVDFNCRSAQEKDLCPGGFCSRDLRVDRAQLLDG